MGTRCCHLSGAFAYLAPCTLDNPHGLAQSSNHVTPGSAVTLFAAVSGAGVEQGCATPAPDLAPSSSSCPHSRRRKGAQGQGHLRCCTQARLSQWVSKDRRLLIGLLA